jgi:hypothetical protein
VVFFGLSALVAALAVGAGVALAVALAACGGAGSTLGGAALAVAGAALDSSTFASDCGEALPPDRNTRMAVTRPTTTADTPATIGIERFGGLRIVGASCVAVRPAPVIISVDALAVSGGAPGAEGRAPKGEGCIEGALGAGANCIEGALGAGADCIEGALGAGGADGHEGALGAGADGHEGALIGGSGGFADG